MKDISPPRQLNADQVEWLTGIVTHPYFAAATRAIEERITVKGVMWDQSHNSHIAAGHIAGFAERGKLIFDIIQDFHDAQAEVHSSDTFATDPDLDNNQHTQHEDQKPFRIAGLKPRK